MSRSTTIITYTGQHYDLANPRPGAVVLEDIAHSLAQTNRWNGHTVRPVSVAEHSLLTAEIVERELGGDIHARLAALLHDAHEYVTGDAVTPMKATLQGYGAGWDEFEARHAHHVRRCFGVLEASRRYADLIKTADHIALLTEQRDLIRHAGQLMDGLQAQAAGWVRLNSPERAAMTWEDWKHRFIDEYQALDFARMEVAA